MADIQWQITSGSLPPGLDLVVDRTSRAGRLVGKPTKAGTYQWTITVTDAVGATANYSYSITIESLLQWGGAVNELSTRRIPLPSAQVNKSYDLSNRLFLRELGVSEEKTFSISVLNGTLPPGLSLTKVDQTRETHPVLGEYDYCYVDITGTPTTAGNYSFTLRGTSGSKTVDLPLTIPVKSVYGGKGTTVGNTSTYSLLVDRTFARESNTVVFTLLATNIANGTNIPFVISGVSAADVSTGLSGNFTMNTVPYTEQGYVTIQGGKIITQPFESYGKVAITINPDVATEDIETMTLTLKDVAPTTSKQVLIGDPTSTISNTFYQLFASANSVTQGSNVTFTLTTNLGQGQNVYYEIRGVTDYDLSGESVRGFFTVGSGGVATKQFTTVDDLLYGSKVMVMTLHSDSSYTSPLNVSTAVELADPAPTYAIKLNSSDAKYNATDKKDIMIDIFTTSVKDNTELPWTISSVFGSSITTSDFVGLASLSGNTTVINNISKLKFTVADDGDGEESFVFNLSGKGVSKTITILPSVVAQPVYNLTIKKFDTSSNSFVGLTTANVMDPILVEGDSFLVEVSHLNGTGIPVNFTANTSNKIISSGRLSGQIIPTNGPTSLVYQTINDGVDGWSLFTFILSNPDTGNEIVRASVQIDSPVVALANAAIDSLVTSGANNDPNIINY